MRWGIQEVQSCMLGWLSDGQQAGAGHQRHLCGTFSRQTRYGSLRAAEAGVLTSACWTGPQMGRVSGLGSSTRVGPQVRPPSSEIDQ